MQWNARSAVSNKCSLVHFLTSNQIDVAIISETWFKPGIAYTFKGYNIVRKDRNDGKAGAAIFIKKNIPFNEIQISDNFTNEILVCGIQISFNKERRWNVEPPSIIVGDLNAHNYM